MRTVTYRLEDLKNLRIDLGFVGENEHRMFRFDCLKAFEECPDAIPSLTVAPPRGDMYPVIITRNGDYVEWVINDSDLVYDGNGEAQLTFTQDTEVMKTCRFGTKVEKSLVPTGTAPTPLADFITQAETILQEVEQAEVNAPRIIEGYWKVWDAEQKEYVSTGVKAEGEDGTPGADGTNAYVWIKYSAAQPTADSDMKSEPDAWMGIYSGSSSTAPAHYTSYTWYKIKGESGGGGSITVDDELSNSSTNPVQNKVITEQVNSLSEAISDIEEELTTPTYTDIMPSSTISSTMIRVDGTSENSSGFVAKRYQVTAGDALYLKISKDSAYSATYQFQNNESIPASDNTYIVGETVTTAVDSTVTVPTGATWLMVSQLSSNTTNLVQKVGEGDTIEIMENKIEQIENEMFVQDKKEGNIIIFDNHVSDAPIHAVSKFQYDSNGFSSAVLTKKQKNIANITYRTDLPGWSTGAYPGTVTGFGTAYVQIFGKQTTVSIQYDVSDSNARTLYVFKYDKDKTLIGKESTGVTGNTRKSITIPAGTEYLIIRADGQSNLTVYGQVEFGGTATEYQVYKGIDYTETFGATIYGGYLDWESGVLTSTLASDGSELSTPVEYNLTPFTIKTFDGITILTPNRGIVEAVSVKKISTKVEELDKDDHPFGTVPGYWEEGNGYLSAKANSIITLARSCASNADMFYFVTDIHWTLNQKHTPAIIDWLNQRINIPRMFNGGDNADYYKDTEEVSRIMRNVMKYGEYYMVDGNHEYLQSKTFSDNFYANRMFADKAVYGDPNRAYYYVDNPASKMRYIILSTYAPWQGGTEQPRLNDADQISWFTNTALDVEDGWTVIVFAHIFSTLNHTLVTGATSYITAMQNMAHGEVACVIQGDQHHDYTMSLANGTIPLVCSTCDKNKPVASNDVEDADKRLAGTTNEQAFDVVVVDKTAKEVHFVRIGYAKTGDEVRTVSYGS